jgi:hypothetical protein
MSVFAWTFLKYSYSNTCHIGMHWWLSLIAIFDPSAGAERDRLGEWQSYWYVVRFVFKASRILDG